MDGSENRASAFPRRTNRALNGLGRNHSPLYPRLQPYGRIGVNNQLGDLSGHSRPRSTIRSTCDALTFGDRAPVCQSSRVVPGTRHTGWRWSAWHATQRRLIWMLSVSASARSYGGSHSDVLRAEIPDMMAELTSLPRAARPQTPGGPRAPIDLGRPICPIDPEG